MKNVSCMSIVITKNRKVLVLNNSGEFVFPKGHVEKGEKYIDTAIRELKEESGVVVNKKDSYGKIDEFSFDFFGEKKKKYIYVYLFVIKEEQKIIFQKEEGFVGGEWVDFDIAKNKLTHNDAKTSLLKALKLI